MATRFTIDGSEGLEQRLADGCARVLEGVRGLMPETRLQALVLGGGYGRGQGGVLQTRHGDLPYNDLEFYLFVRGSRLFSEHRFSAPLRNLGEQLTPEIGAHVEFKIETVTHFGRLPVSMFSYDLAAGHRIVFGEETLFSQCEGHLDPARIPLSEATRLLFNRCSGLLLAREYLSRPSSGDEPETDFVVRNIAKTRLAMGDAVLTAFGAYHWDCLERQRRLQNLQTFEPIPWLDLVRHHHAAGVQFKLRPARAFELTSDIQSLHRETLELSRTIWLWLESRRLNRAFGSVSEYAACRVPKCPDTSAWRNVLLNLKSFGPRGVLSLMACRYPRERLLNCLPLLLWIEDPAGRSQATAQLQKQLHTSASDWSGLVSAYKSFWPAYG